MKQFVSFLGVGTLATACHYIVLIALVEGFHVGPVSASVAGAIVGACVSYLLNKTITFHSDLPHTSAMPKFFAVAALAVFMNFIFMKFFTQSLALPYFIAQVITTALLILITFGLNKLWSFAKVDGTKDGPFES